MVYKHAKHTILKEKGQKRKAFLTYKAVGEEFVDRSKGEACDWSSGVLRADHLEEGPEKNVGFHI